MRLRSRRSLLAIATLASACSGAGGAASCGEPEQLVEAGSIHVLPGAEVGFAHSPPTSGPHEIPGPVEGVHRSPITEPRQVAALESGLVLLQYGTDAAAADVEALRGLAGEHGVVVAPGARRFDNGADIAFTAWGVRQLCNGLDLEAARAFVDRHRGGAGAHHAG